ncbi:hypothetical protein [Curtobacterium sp. ZW137]|uniref:hypothetical protein n=1 Tax=Curtobacterium sp. ZW137 TaxID=2485104 RepID=UPI000F4AFF2E|nr:hypothetical protein [Curtobacterium sp. ZW137]
MVGFADQIGFADHALTVVPNVDGVAHGEAGRSSPVLCTLNQYRVAFARRGPRYGTFCVAADVTFPESHTSPVPAAAAVGDVATTIR